MNPKEDKSKDINKSSERKIPYQYLDIEAIFDKVYPKVKPAKKKKDKLETKKIKKERVTYSQDWSAYNQAQSKEKLYFKSKNFLGFNFNSPTISEDVLPN